MTTPKCPICRVPVASREAFPFCSDRCRLIDLGRWLGGEYRIPTEEAPGSETQSEPEEETDECASRS